MICNAILYKIVTEYFRDMPYYTKVLELFFEVILCTGIGQGIDMTTAPKDAISFSEFSIER